jgi:hypothetical protein
MQDTEMRGVLGFARASEEPIGDERCTNGWNNIMDDLEARLAGFTEANQFLSEELLEPADVLDVKVRIRVSLFVQEVPPLCGLRCIFVCVCVHVRVYLRVRVRVRVRASLVVCLICVCV